MENMVPFLILKYFFLKNFDILYTGKLEKGKADVISERNFIKGRKLTGLPVIALDLGSELGAVKEILYEPREQRILALLLEEGGWIKGAKIVTWQDLRHIGEDAVTVQGAEVVLDSNSQKELQELCKNRTGLKGYKLLTEKGVELGIIEDILFDPSSGEIVGYELSRGVVQDLLDGRWEAILPENMLPDCLVFGENTVVIPEGQAQISQPELG